MSDAFRTTVGLRGRITLPAAIQEAAGLAVGDPIVVRAVGPGVIAIETPQAIKDRIRTEEGDHEGPARQ